MTPIICYSTVLIQMPQIHSIILPVWPPLRLVWELPRCLGLYDWSPWQLQISLLKPPMIHLLNTWNQNLTIHHLLHDYNIWYIWLSNVKQKSVSWHFTSFQHFLKITSWYLGLEVKMKFESLGFIQNLSLGLSFMFKNKINIVKGWIRWAKVKTILKVFLFCFVFGVFLKQNSRKTSYWKLTI